MGFLDIFRPNWRHSDVEVRAKAVRELARHDHEILAEIARKDADLKVRRLAVKKLEDPGVLREIADSDADEGLRRLAGEKAAEILTSRASAGDDESVALRALDDLASDRELAAVARSAQLATVRLAAVQRIKDERALADVARNGEQPDVRKIACERVHDADTLREIAMAEEVKAVAMIALERIDDPATLDTIARKAQSKAVRTAAKKRAEELAPKKHAKAAASVTEEQIRHARRLQLCRELEAIALTNDWEAGDRMEAAARAEWEQMGKPDDAELQARFERACQRYDRRHEEYDRVKAEIARRRAESEKPVVVARPAAPEPAVDAAPAAETETAPASAPGDEVRPPEVDAEAMLAFQRREEEKRARKAAEQAEREAEELANAAQWEMECATLEGLANTDRIKDADRALKNAATALRKLEKRLPRAEKDALVARYNAARDGLAARIQEIRETEEWKRFTNVPKLEHLIAQAEALLQVVTEAQQPKPEAAEAAPPVETTDAVEATPSVAEEEPEVDDRGRMREAQRILRDLQNEWKNAGPAPRNRSEQLWGKFKETCDKVHAAVSGRLGAAQGDPAQNLAAKLALCEKVEGLKESTDWEATAEEIKRLQDEWRRIGPVPVEQKEEVWQRFRAACDVFFAGRKDHLKELRGERDANYDKKVALCEKVEGLVQAINPQVVNWKDTAEEVKKLQAEWKSIGPVPHKKSDAIWKRFRGACDKFFEMRGAAFQELDAGREANTKAKEALCEKVEAVVGSEDYDGAIKIAKEAQAEWKKIGPVSRDANQKLWKRFRKACDQVFEGPDAGSFDDLPKEQGRFENRIPLGGIVSQVVVSADAEMAAGMANEVHTETVRPVKVKPEAANPTPANPVDATPAVVDTAAVAPTTTEPSAVDENWE